MTPQEIKYNAPEGATHYIEKNGYIVYCKILDDWTVMASILNRYWITSDCINYRELIPINPKPLN